MTVGARWWSQPVAAEGSTASEGIRRQQGKSQFDPLAVLIRETAQNTCDAALPGESDIEFSVRLDCMSDQAGVAWREFLLPEPEKSGLHLERAMASAPIMLSLSDRGTTGLGGPLRADRPPEKGERPDFVNFIRNVGERKTVDLGGGSYGFGKSILYNISRCHVVVVDSVCIFRGRRERRLIGAALGDGYSHRNTLYTGRHWLGAPDEDGHNRPLLGEDADFVAGRLGLPNFGTGETGTTITIVDADLGRDSESDRTREPESAARYIASAMLWHLWPRMLQGRSHRLACSVRLDGSPIEIPVPERVIELRPFIDAYHALKEKEGYLVPRRARPPKEIGRFARRDGIAPAHSDKLLALAAPFSGRAHHCARMRQVDLIVDYAAGDVVVDEAVQRGAVFRAGVDADAYFAEAEPPTHDAWVTSGLRGTARGVVQLANTFVSEEMRDRREDGGLSTNTDETPLAALSGRLSGLLTAEGDHATASSGGGPGHGGGRNSARPRFVQTPELVDEDGIPVILAVIELPTWPTPRTVIAQPVVIVDSGIEGDEGRFLGVPEVLGWQSIASDAAVDGAALTVTPGSDREWQLRIRPLQDAVIRVRIIVDEQRRDG